MAEIVEMESLVSKPVLKKILFDKSQKVLRGHLNILGCG